MEEVTLKLRSESAKEDTEKGVRRKKREEETDLQRLEIICHL